MLKRAAWTADAFWATPDPDLAVHVGDAAVTLGSSVELADLFNAEALSEGLPHTGAEPVTHSQAHAVPTLWWAHRLRQQVAADLTDVLHHLEERKNIMRCDRLHIKLLLNININIITNTTTTTI